MQLRLLHKFTIKSGNNTTFRQYFFTFFIATLDFPTLTRSPLTSPLTSPSLFPIIFFPTIFLLTLLLLTTS